MNRIRVKYALNDKFFTRFQKSTTNGLTFVNLHNMSPNTIFIKYLPGDNYNLEIPNNEMIRWTGTYGYGIPYGQSIEVKKSNNCDVININEPMSDIYIY